MNFKKIIILLQKPFLNILKGREGEEIAIDYLKKRGFKVVERNFRVKGAEADLICTYENKVVVVEVKLRTNKSFGEPYEAVSRKKIGRLKLLGAVFCRKKNVSYSQLRIDVISIFKDKNRTEIRHFENIG